MCGITERGFFCGKLCRSQLSAEFSTVDFKKSSNFTSMGKNSLPAAVKNLNFPYKEDNKDIGIISVNML